MIISDRSKPSPKTSLEVSSQIWPFPLAIAPAASPILFYIICTPSSQWRVQQTQRHPYKQSIILLTSNYSTISTNYGLMASVTWSHYPSWSFAAISRLEKVQSWRPFLGYHSQQKTIYVLDSPLRSSSEEHRTSKSRSPSRPVLEENKMKHKSYNSST